MLTLFCLYRGDRAVGVEYISHDPDAADKEAVVSVYASRLVVLAGGAFGSPAILERCVPVLFPCKVFLIDQGRESVRPICSKHTTFLRLSTFRASVKTTTVLDTFKNLLHCSCILDHNLIMLPYHTSDDEITMDDIWHGEPEKIKSMCIVFSAIEPL